MKKVCFLIFITIVLSLSCGKSRKPEYKLLDVGPGKFNPARPDTEYVVHIYIPHDVSAKDAESLSVAVLKEHLAKNPTWKKATLKAHKDSTKFAIRREEIQILWYGAGEPQLVLRRWETGTKSGKNKK